MYQVTSDDGNGAVVQRQLTRQQLCGMIGRAILLGAIVSEEIEGEGREDVELKEPVNLPEALLRTPIEP